MQRSKDEDSNPGMQAEDVIGEYLSTIKTPVWLIGSGVDDYKVWI